ncbi:MAG: Asp-tRNA(Asn)/Glu-tRNA(Gln) amidotransferase subunit GatC [Angelakisella sp.]
MEIDIKKIAKLSRLAIEPEREEKFQKDMQNIIEMAERLPEMETGDLSPKVEDTMTLREDVVEPSLPRDEVLEECSAGGGRLCGSAKDGRLTRGKGSGQHGTV